MPRRGQPARDAARQLGVGGFRLKAAAQLDYSLAPARVTCNARRAIGDALSYTPSTLLSLSLFLSLVSYEQKDVEPSFSHLADQTCARSSLAMYRAFLFPLLVRRRSTTIFGIFARGKRTCRGAELFGWRYQIFLA